MKINFKEVKVPTSIKKEEFRSEDLRENLANAIYNNERDIAYMSLAMKIYNSDGEVELDEKETNLLKNFCKNLPLVVQDALRLLR